MILFLTGFMGCGKSTVGRRVAARLGYHFIDMDKEIEDWAGKSIVEIFRDSGEEAFREMERKMLLEVPARGDMIIATGGGTPCFGDNLELMKCKGRVVYFRTSPEVLLPRLKRGRNRRPKIADMDDSSLMGYISETIGRREKYYLQASVVIDCDGVGDEYVAAHLENYILNTESQG